MLHTPRESLVFNPEAFKVIDSNTRGTLWAFPVIFAVSYAIKHSMLHTPRESLVFNPEAFKVIDSNTRGTLWAFPVIFAVSYAIIHSIVCYILLEKA